MKKLSLSPVRALVSAAFCTTMAVGNVQAVQAGSLEENSPDTNITLTEAPSYNVADDNAYVHNSATLFENLTVEYPTVDSYDNTESQDLVVSNMGEIDMAALSVTAALFAMNIADDDGPGKRYKARKSSNSSQCYKIKKKHNAAYKAQKANKKRFKQYNR